MSDLRTATTINWAPLFATDILSAMVAIVVVLVLLSLFFYRRGLFWRALCAAAFLGLFFNPSLVEEKREPVPDVAAVVVDRSPSQQYGQRDERAEEAYAWLKEQLGKKQGLETRFVEAGASADGEETRLFEALDRTLADIPVNRRAGVVFITDGQVHDVPANPSRFNDYGPVHTLLTGDHDEHDRQLVILEAPSYGIVGQNVTVRYRVNDSRPAYGEQATLLVRRPGETPLVINIPVNEDQTLTLKIGHAGQNIFDMEASGVEGELTEANNRVPLVVNGVRDRLRVLLVSGQPHAGGRTWRNLLTSDPGVDLVHFTILREPDKLDATPQNELSLIAFPFQELFEVKLYDFDLIIFDRYRLNRILPNYYFGNIARYVKQGGALLEASGPSFASEDSIYSTDLQQILPAYPTGQVYEQPYKPRLTEEGQLHPVTEGLQTLTADNNPAWGSWLRQVAVQPSSGHVLMKGLNGLPLLVLDRVGEGRVAQLASDEIWLWSRGFEGGGPHVELLRRLAHWLMKEPELEENALEVSGENNALFIRRRTLTDKPVEIRITGPDGKQETLTLEPDEQGKLETVFPASRQGVYTIDDGTQKRLALVGNPNAPELKNILTTEDKLSPLVKATKGASLWLTDTDKPAVRMQPAGRDFGGRNWIGLRENNSFNITGIMNKALLPAWLYALLLLAAVIGSWWFEGRNRAR